jgi:DNA-binding ferritin-like protein (Dps family)
MKWYVILLIVIACVLLVLVPILAVSSRSLRQTTQPARSFLTLDEFEKLGLETKDATKQIPKYLFRTASFTVKNMPRAVKDVLNKSARNNPGYTVVYADDVACDAFIAANYPEYFSDYDALIPGAFRADVWRMLVLYKYGGIYNDIGHEYLVPISAAITDEDEFVTVAETGGFVGIHNALLAAYPRHPLIKHMIETVMKFVSRRLWGRHCLDVTGPLRLGVAYRSFMNEIEKVSEFITPGRYTKNGHRVTFFILSNNFIKDGDTQKSLLTRKFYNYHTIMYSRRKVKYYAELYNEGRLYKDVLRM